MSLMRTIRRLLKRTFESAGAGSRWPVTVGLPSPARQVLAAAPLTRSRASWLIANTGIGESIVSTWGVHLVGDVGPTARSGHPNKAMARALDGAWLDAYDRMGIDGSDLTSILMQLARSLVGAGEALVRFITNERGEVKVQVLLPEQLDASVNKETGDGNVVVAGVEFDALGRIVAYHIRANPDLGYVATQATRVVAADVVHLFERRWPGQTRGLSWLAPVATRIVELDALEDAGLVKAKTSALMCGVVRDLDGQGTSVADLNAMMPLEPGAMVGPLPPGADISWTPTSDFQGIDAFTRHMVRSIAAGVGLPYELLAADMSQTNYSSAKMGMENFKRKVKGIRASILVSGFLRPLWQRFVTLEVLSGRLNAPSFTRDPSPFFDVSFIFPTWAALDPLKESQAYQILLGSGLVSRQQIISELGRDPDEVSDEIAADTFTPSNVVPITESAA